MPRARTHRIGLFAPPPGAVAAAPFQEDEFTVTSNGQTVFNLSQNYAANGLAVPSVRGKVVAVGTDVTLVGNVMTWLDNEFTLEIGDCIIVTYEYVP